MDYPRVVFIGGTGRCGTNALKNALSDHPRCCALPFEHRITIDPDGIVDFYVQCQHLWSPYLMDVRIRRLERLLSNKYEGWELDKWFPHYYRHVERLIDGLKSFQFNGQWPGNNTGVVYYGSKMGKETLRLWLEKFLFRLHAGFILESRKNGKPQADIFVDDNTWNILFVKQLSELVPNNKFINVRRRRLEVVDSLAKQRWTPNKYDCVYKYHDDLTTQIEKSLTEDVLTIDVESYDIEDVYEFIGANK